MTDYISIRGVRTHNLKGINLDLPRNKLIVITGPSGSGKSSLAFNTLYAEGQRRYMESLSAYARQFLPTMVPPEVEHIEGLSPTIAIGQRGSSYNPRSTVGTITEIYDYLRLLYARVGTPHCPDHGVIPQARTIFQITEEILKLPTGAAYMILAPITNKVKNGDKRVLEYLAQQGFIRIRIDKQVHELNQQLDFDCTQAETIEVIIDRFKIRPEIKLRLAESLESALKLSRGIVSVAAMNNPLEDEKIFSTGFSCLICDYSLTELTPHLFSFNHPKGICPQCHGLGLIQESEICLQCLGKRLNQQGRNVFIDEYSLPMLTALSLVQINEFFSQLKFTGQKKFISNTIIKEIQTRLNFLIDMRLGYLSLDRRADTLSGGEFQRTHLANQLGVRLSGVIYILDEPSIGLHQQDNKRLLAALTYLRDLGNTVVVIEHDKDTIELADYIVDMGPGAGIHGGEVIAQGTVAEIKANPNSLTGRYLSGTLSIPIPSQRIKPNSNRIISICGATGNNLQNINVEFPLGLMICVTGVSGSGKSTLINDTLFPIIAQKLYQATTKPAPYQSIEGVSHIDKMINIDQSPIGRTPRSNPATYTDIFSTIRCLFTETHEARSRGYNPNRFSFNVKGGRCEPCQGNGLIKVEMNFLPDIYVPCDICQGTQYNAETLEILYKGKNIHEVLEMTVEEAHDFFHAIPVLTRKLQTLIELGLSYIKLGQSGVTLSGGEAQRIKLAKELAKRDTSRTLYIFDEPTTGLHFHDIAQLLKILLEIRDRGNTLIIIEHHLDVIKTADWIIDLGSEGGSKGGKVIGIGTPEIIAKNKNSYTGRYLAEVLLN
ncbi:excinuclease ABC subunit UvrA [Candidatus Nitrosacidococcus sp. I8]|uniref:excinuclease ABC subunit UvrA n=1 Tax=Candidatus Nitrosacidococcus sp. I8 TaxID=2942908 RepID=UPI002225F17C|nr:excinuclease ABC subunit UvrA [Candidatus Nitrosacidococcus sp. I8]CAH9019640.1 UvrABC system protein A [Candidatus Nitrosacidococcus sp. I8]